MLLNISKKYNIDLKTSFMIGNSLIDIETGKNAGCKTILVKENQFYESISTVI